MISEYHAGRRDAGGYTCFEEVARHATRLARETGQFTIAVVVGDGSISGHCVAKTIAAVRDAANTRVGFVFVGVGRPRNPSDHWALMKELDDMKGRVRFCTKVSRVRFYLSFAI